MSDSGTTGTSDPGTQPQSFNCQTVLKFIAATLTLLVAVTVTVTILFSVRLHYLRKNGDDATVYDHILAASLEEPLRTLEWVSGSLREYFAESCLLATGILTRSRSSSQKGSTLTQIQPSWAESKQFVKDFLFELKAKYPSQPQRTWFKLYAALTSTLTQEIPGRPSTLLFLSSSSTKDFSECFAREISFKMHTAFAKATDVKCSANTMEISPQSLESKDLDAIHSELNDYLKSGKVVIVRDLDQIIDEEHLFLFHAFCDHFEAPDKRATFIFLITIPPDAMEVASSLSEEGQETELVELILDAAWTTLSPVKRPAIISRIASNVIRIQPGDSCLGTQPLFLG